MALTRVQATPKWATGSQGNATLVFDAPPTLGNAIVVPVSQWSGQSPVVTDNYGNKYDPVITRVNGNPRVTMFVCPIITATGPTFTITVNHGGFGWSVTLAIEVGLPANKALIVDRFAGKTGSSTAPSPGPAGTVSVNDVFIATVVGMNKTQSFITVRPDLPPWFQEAEELTTSSIATEINSRVLIDGLGSTQTPVWDVSTVTDWAAVSVVFKAANLPRQPITRVNAVAVSDWSHLNLGTSYASPPQVLTAKNALIVIAGGYATAGQTITGVTDSAGNTFTKVAHCFEAGDKYREEVWYATNILAHSNNIVTVTWSADVAYRGIVALQYKNLPPLAFEATAQGTIPSGTSVSTSLLTTTKYDSLHLLIPRWGNISDTVPTFPQGFASVSPDSQVRVGERLFNQPFVGTHTITYFGSPSSGKFALAVTFAVDQLPTESRLSQAVLEVVNHPQAVVRATQSVIEVLASPEPSPAWVTQEVVEVLAQPTPPPVMTQVVAEMLSAAETPQFNFSQVSVEMISSASSAPGRVSQVVVETLQQWKLVPLGDVPSVWTGTGGGRVWSE